MIPEKKARVEIDRQLFACGWAVQNYKEYHPSAASGIALREVPLKSGRCDYLLLVDRKPLGIIEAKKEGTLLSTVADQSGHYGENLPDFLHEQLSGPLPFLYKSTGVETYFRDKRDPEACSLEELEVVVSANLQRATPLRQSILNKAFKGEL
ncbi:MAG: type I restriction endonuclease [Chthoniobacteraceae bacterium]